MKELIKKFVDYAKTKGWIVDDVPKTHTGVTISMKQSFIIQDGSDIKIITFADNSQGIMIDGQVYDCEICFYKKSIDDNDEDNTTFTGSQVNLPTFDYLSAEIESGE